jgi:hypothetical protein
MKQLTFKKRGSMQIVKRTANNTLAAEELRPALCALPYVKNQEVTMETTEYLSEVTDQFVLAVGAKVLGDIDTPAFMRKEYGIHLEDTEKSSSSSTSTSESSSRSSSAGAVVEPDEKIIRFLSVIKRKDFAISPG